MTALDDPRTTPGDELDPTLVTHLNAAAGHLTPPPGDLAAVMARGKTRQGRARLLAGATALVLVAGATTGVVAITGDRPDPLVTAGGTPHGPLQWRRADPSTALGYATGLSGTDGRFALSTAPGLASGPEPGPRVLYRSDDGVSWAAATTLGADLNLADLARSGDRLYAVGTGPATAATAGRPASPDLIVAWSDDGGSTFQRASLPIDLRAVAAKATQVHVTPMRIAAGGGHVVALATIGAELDVAKVLPKGVTVAHGWALGAGGIDLLGPLPASPCPPGTTDSPPGKLIPTTVAPGEPGVPPTQRVYPTYCYGDDAGPDERRDIPVEFSPQEVRGVARHLTWAELGVSADLLRAVTSQPVSFVAKEGSTSFARVELPVSDAPDRSQMTALSGGPAGVRLVVSNYPRLSQPPQPPQALRLTDGRWTATDGPPGIWEPLALGTVQGRTAVVGRGPEVRVLLAVEDGAGGWTTTDLTAATGGGPGLAAAGIGPMGVVAVVGSTDGRIAEGTVLVSRDGISVERWSLADLVGAKAQGVTKVVVGTDQIQVGVLLAGGGPADPLRQAVLVGTTKT